MDQHSTSKRGRSRSPLRDWKHQRKHSPDRWTRHSHETSTKAVDWALPFNARQLTKHDLDHFEPMFALYLDIQKRINVEDLTETELKGRWKSFMNKWNRGDLAEGWYDPATLLKAQRAAQDDAAQTLNREQRQGQTISREGSMEKETSIPNMHPAHDDSSEDDEFGPSLLTDPTVYPRANLSYFDVKAGPGSPTVQDLRYQQEQEREASLQAREQTRAKVQQDRKNERKLAKDRLEDLAPRAAAGTRERQVEKKRDVAASNRAFAASKDAAGDVELRDMDVMGEDTMGELKRMKQIEQRKKNERELRREELLRARKAEREDRQKGLREKEDKTMAMLKQLAKERFGGGD